MKPAPQFTLDDVASDDDMLYADHIPTPGPNIPLAMPHSGVTPGYLNAGSGGAAAPVSGGGSAPSSKKVPITIKKRTDLSSKTDYGGMFEVQLENSLPSGPEYTCEDCSERVAEVICETCDAAYGCGALCTGCDAKRHRGPVCNPNGHDRFTIRDGHSLLPTQALSFDGTKQVPLKDVFLRCAAHCPNCSARHSLEPTGKPERHGLTIVTEKGRFYVDRTAVKCNSCTYEIGPGDTRQYLTRSTIPATAGGKVKTVFSRGTAMLLTRVRRASPGLSATCMATALTAATKATSPHRLKDTGCIVRPETVSDVLQLIEALDSSNDRTVHAPKIYHVGLGPNQVVGFDGCDKLRMSLQMTRACVRWLSENYERIEALPDW